MRINSLFLITILFLLFSTNISSQIPCSLFSQAYENYENGELQKAATSLQQFAEQNPNSAIDDFIWYGIGEVYLQLNQLEEAESAFRKVLHNTHSSKRRIRPTEYMKCQSFMKGFMARGNDLVSFTKSSSLYYFEMDACKRLHEIALQKNEPYAALRYLRLAETDFFQHGGCGNEILMLKSGLGLDIAEVYLMLGDTTNAQCH